MVASDDTVMCFNYAFDEATMSLGKRLEIIACSHGHAISSRIAFPSKTHKSSVLGTRE